MSGQITANGIARPAGTGGTAQQAPYNPDLSPWFRNEPIMPPEGCFILPENAVRRAGDLFFFGSHSWARDFSFLNQPTVREDAAHTRGKSILAYARPITNDPTLHKRMQSWAAGALSYAETSWFWRDEDDALQMSRLDNLPSSAAVGKDRATVQRDEPANPANFVVQVDNPALSEAVQRVAFAAGLGWELDGARVQHANSTALVVSRTASSLDDCTWMADRLYRASSNNERMRNRLPHYNAATQFGEIVRLLSTPVKPPRPEIPEVHGHHMNPYAKGGDTVAFGCAVISLDLLRVTFTAPYPGNRTVDSIMLSSGKRIDRAQATEIFAYVDYVNSQP